MLIKDQSYGSFLFNRYSLFSACFCLVFTFIGYWLGNYSLMPSVTTTYWTAQDVINEPVKTFLVSFPGEIQDLAIILAHNITILIVILFLGIRIIKPYVLFVIPIFNGLFLGLTIRMVLPYLGMLPLLSLLLPHGVVEFSIFFVSIGTVFAIEKYDFTFKREIRNKFFPYLLSLLIVAGLIETFITPKIAGMIL